MNRRGFLQALGGLIVAPKFGRFFREGSGRIATFQWDDTTPAIWNAAPTGNAGPLTLKMIDQALQAVYHQPLQMSMRQETYLLTMFR